MALAACWLLLLPLAHFVAGLRAVEGLSYAALLCFVPGALLSLKRLVVRDDHPVAEILSGIGLRVVIVVAGAWLVSTIRPDMTERTFLYWLIPVYCVALAVETHQALKAESLRGSGAQSANSD